nr:lipid A export permease/ATP-binding protein MsbA [Inmirania thermothiophila]
MAGRELYLRLLRYVRPYWRVFAVAVLGMVGFAATEPALSALLKPMLDGSFIARDARMTTLVPLALIAVFLVRGISSYAATVGMAWVANHVVMDLRRDLFQQLLVLPARFYAGHATGRLVSKVTYDVAQVAQASTQALVVLVQDGLAVVGLIGWMLWLNWRLTLIAFVVLPVLAVTVRLASRRLRSLSGRLQRAMGDMTHVLEEAVGGYRIVRIFGGEDYERGRFAAVNDAVRRLNTRVTATSSAFVSVVQVAAVAALALIVYVAARQAASDQFTVGGFVSFFAAIGLLFRPLKRLTQINEQLQKGIAAAESAFALLDEPAEPARGRLRPERVRAALAFEGVGFAYDREPVLHDVDLQVAPGETVALVGPSGSGKTTLAMLLPRFYDPTAGRILLDGVDLRELDLAWLRAQIAYVSQEIVLFNDTVRANIAYGALAGADDEAVRRAAEAADALEFIERLPEGFDTVIGERGVRLSGGQRQRLAIARAILKDAPILILDEATSALDSAAERRVQAAVDRLRTGRTSIVIAHRLSTIERADRIVVLDRGRIVETGTHADLLAAGGLYAELQRLQRAKG